MDKPIFRTDIDAVIAQALPPRTYSAVFTEGVRAALRRHAFNSQYELPYAPGTVEADAFFAGADEGHAIFRRIWHRGTQLEPREAA